MKSDDKAAAEVRKRQENVRRYRAILMEDDKPRLESARRNLEEAKKVLVEAEKAVELGESMLRIEELKLTDAYREFFETCGR